MTQPNILLLFSDEHSFRCMGHRGLERGGEPVETPHFDRLASQGTVFTDTYCQMPLCTPSRLCLLTGMHARAAGAWDNNAVLPPDRPTIAHTLAAAGYTTCLVGKMHLGGNRQFVGFQHRPYGDLTGKTGHQWEPFGPDGKPQQSMRDRTAGAGVTVLPESMIQDEVVCQETVAFLREHQHGKPDTPWFLTASFSRPHFPLTAPRRWFDRYWPDGVTQPRVPAGGDAWDHPMSVGMRKGFYAHAIDHDEMMRARAAYFACVSYLDEVIGDLFMRLQASGLLDNTIIIYVSDHGELMGEHGVWWKHGWFEGCTRVPMIISTPQQRRGEQQAAEVTAPAALIDLHATCAALAGATPPDDLEGADLSAVVRGDTDAADTDRAVFSDNLVPRWGEGTQFRAIRWRQWKYVAFKDAPPLMFDLETDPAEQHNLLQRERGEEAEATRRRLEQLAAQSIDFDAAERDRIEVGDALRKQYPLDREGSQGNLYHLPDGRVVNADDAIYAPTVISEDAAKTFSDYGR